MKLEIYDEVSGETREFQSSDLEVTIGSRDGNTLVLDTPGVSGKHAKIIDDGQGNLKIIDLDSKNGTFINNERLEPNTETDFNTFFHVSLAKLVNISIVEEDEASAKSVFKKAGQKPLGNNTVQKVEGRRKRKTSTGTSTSTMIVGGGKRKRKKKKKKKEPTVNPIIVIACIGIASIFAFNYFSQEDSLPTPTKVVKKKASKKKKKNKNKVIAKKKSQNDKLSLPNQEILTSDKCLTSAERPFCAYLPKRGAMEGFFIKNNVLYMVADGVMLYNSIPNIQITDDLKPKILENYKRRYKTYFKLGDEVASNYRINRNITNSERVLLGLLYFFKNKNFTQDLLYNDDINALEVLIINNKATKMEEAPLNQAVLEFEKFQGIHDWNSTLIKNEVELAKRTFWLEDVLKKAEEFLSKYNEDPKAKKARSRRR